MMQRNNFGNEYSDGSDARRTKRSLQAKTIKRTEKKPRNEMIKRLNQYEAINLSP